MILKRDHSKSDEPGARRRKPREPLDVHMSVTFRFGDEPGDRIRVMDDVKVPMVDSVFANRDRIVRGFVSLLMSSGLRSQKVVSEIVPVLKLLRRR